MRVLSPTEKIRRISLKRARLPKLAEEELAMDMSNRMKAE
jgi:hypothetical protein